MDCILCNQFVPLNWGTSLGVFSMRFTSNNHKLQKYIKTMKRFAVKFVKKKYPDLRQWQFHMSKEIIEKDTVQLTGFVMKKFFGFLPSARKTGLAGLPDFKKG